jgi:hypothetical protein
VWSCAGRASGGFHIETITFALSHSSLLSRMGASV